MFGTLRKENAVRTAEYATHADFCRTFQENMQPLYLLAFLLTANHASAERCFVASLDDSIKGNAVFKEWASSWSRFAVIRNAIRMVLASSAPTNEKPERWSTAKPETQASAVIDGVTHLTTLERFVFVMSVLEGCSDRKCCIMLSCTLKDLLQTRLNALRRLPTLISQHQEGEASGRDHSERGIIKRKLSTHFSLSEWKQPGHIASK
jgi:hypothetical protein